MRLRTINRRAALAILAFLLMPLRGNSSIRLRSRLKLLPVLALDHQAVAVREIIDADVDRWLAIGLEESWGWPAVLQHSDRLVRLASLMMSAPDYRPIFFYRVKRASAAPRLVKFARRLFPEPAEVHLRCASIGPGLFMPHAYTTIIAARRLGHSCRIHQNVTIGWNGVGQEPSIGDRVTIYTGAVVVGDVTIGDDATIGANAFVNCNVPAGATFAGVPARAIARSDAPPDTGASAFLT